MVRPKQPGLEHIMGGTLLACHGGADRADRNIARGLRGLGKVAEEGLDRDAASRQRLVADGQRKSARDAPGKKKMIKVLG